MDGSDNVTDIINCVVGTAHGLNITSNSTIILDRNQVTQADPPKAKAFRRTGKPKLGINYVMEIDLTALMIDLITCSHDTS